VTTTAWAADDVDLGGFDGESEAHRPLSTLRAMCRQARVVEDYGSGLKACRPGAPQRVMLEKLALELNADLCADEGQLPLEIDVARANLEEVQKEREQAKSEGGVAAVRSQEAVQAAEAGLSRAKAAAKKRDELNTVMNAVLFDTASWQDFQAYKKDSDRQSLCSTFSNALYGKTEDTAGAAVAAQAVAEQAHATDTLRRSSNLSTALSTAAGVIEKPGAPDAVAASIMTSLGADRTTNGSQAVFTLNIASLVEPSTSRLKSSAAWRNLFLRASMPLDSTEGENLAPAARQAEEAAEPADPAAPTATPAADVTRFSFVLGTSLIDDSDTRLEENRQCFERVVTYLPVGSTEGGESRSKGLRKVFFDECAHAAAKAQRLALRVGVALATDETEQKTHVELAAAAIVWGPTPYLYLNGIYQHVYRPNVVDTVGAGFSLGTNASSSASGVDAWGRISLDAFWLVSRVDDQWVMEGRIVPTAQFRLGDAIASLGVGPRLIGGDSKGASLLATLALTYDADRLINPLLTPLQPPAK
jgi:hypothetical protein